jgi:hypothetical protein
MHGDKMPSRLACGAFWSAERQFRFRVPGGKRRWRAHSPKPAGLSGAHQTQSIPSQVAVNLTKFDLIALNLTWFDQKK